MILVSGGRGSPNMGKQEVAGEGVTKPKRTNRAEGRNRNVHLF